MLETWPIDQSVFPQKCCGAVQTNHAATVPNGTKLAVGQVAGHWNVPQREARDENERYLSEKLKKNCIKPDASRLLGGRGSTPPASTPPALSKPGRRQVAQVSGQK